MGTTFCKEARCRVSDPSNPRTHELVGEDPRSGCANCGDEFKLGCEHYPRKVRHIYHSQHPLTLINRSDETGIAILERDKCNWCGGDLSNMFYRCSICGFCLDLHCFLKNPSPTITNPKSHHHPLLFFPRPFLLPCDACGLVNISEPVYTCFQCHYVVHQSCIDLPREIKITRHPHRLSYTPFSPPDYSTCQICYKSVDIKYGQYSCDHEGCSYVAHSKCATHEKVWDGNELEWEPDDTNETEDIAPFEKVSVGVIKYFCHEHHLKLHSYDRVRDADKQCEACILPMEYSRDFYTCMQCDFYLHQVCASLPRKFCHASHQHPLFLDPSPPNDDKYCSTCVREFSGFQYKCSRDDCQTTAPNFKVDIRCILVPDISTYKCHVHPLFINTCFSRGDTFYCNGCKRSRKDQMSRLECTLCEFILCYFCATLPDEVYYKHSEHPLSLCYGDEDVDDTYWCETCEKMIDPTRWFYTSTKWCITIHIGCILGTTMYMKHGFTYREGNDNLEIVRNSSNSRPICCRCAKRCQDLVYYKHQEMSFCSTECSRNYRIRHKALPLLDSHFLGRVSATVKQWL
ncbi:hypothetical protein N665_0114s0020 [Sinapis alba]|nr:hypothetical protein N665_0114s0020 [Sinapis alba]